MGVNVISHPPTLPPHRNAFTHQEKQVPAERVEVARSLCAARGVQLTTLRQQVLELLWENERPTGAYELIEALKTRHARPIGPPTVYRALEFLMSQGLASKIESHSAYVACAHPERPHDCLFFICSDCGLSAELEDPRVERLLTEDAANHLGFKVKRSVVEVEGICSHCTTTDTPVQTRAR